MQRDNTVLAFEDHLAPRLDIKTPPIISGKPKTLREYYFSEIITIPEISDQSDGALKEDIYAIQNWELHTENRPIHRVNRDDLVALRDGMKSAGLKPATINKTWRKVAAMLRIAVELEALAKMPKISLRSKSRLIKEETKIQREILTSEDLESLHAACRYATYPDPARWPTEQMWQAILLMFYLYGPRTRDLVRLRWKSIQTRSRLVKFPAMKTRKIQGLPLTDLVMSHLNAMRGIDPEYIFGPMKTPGAYRKKEKRWTPGYYTTWRTEILPGSNVVDSEAHLNYGETYFKHFRETMVTVQNGVEDRLGDWMAGHYQSGVSAKCYEFPTKRIREAIAKVESDIPDCFRRIHSSVG